MTSKNSIAVRELYPVANGFIWKRLRCPPVDWSQETAWSMDAAGKVVALANESDCDAAAKSGARLFALAKGMIPFSRTAVGVLEEDAWKFNFIMSGDLVIVDAEKFLRAWAKAGGAFGVEGLSSKAIVDKVWTELETVIRNEVHDAAGNFKVAEIDERDVIPCTTWSALFKKAGCNPGSLLPGLEVNVTFKRLVSPDREVEQKRIAALEAQRELEEREQLAYQALVDEKTKAAELEAIEQSRQQARREAELRDAELEVAIAKQKINVQLYEQKNLNDERLRLQKAMDDEEIRKNEALRKGDERQVSEIDKLMSKMARVMGELTSRLEEIAKYVPANANVGAAAAPVDPVVAPRYHGMSDCFAEVMATVRASSKDALTVSLRTADCGDGGSFATRSVFTSGAATRDLMAGGTERLDEEGGRDVLRLGDRLTLCLRSARRGYLTLFNLGSSGKVLKMFPNRAFGTTSNFIEANRVYSLPGELMDGKYLDQGYWIETGPVSSKTGLPERILAVLTDSPVNLTEEALAPLVSRYGTRGGFAAVEEEVSSLFNLQDGTWCHGLVEAWVER